MVNAFITVTATVSGSIGLRKISPTPRRDATGT